ncbi:MFS transporter [bacterium]|nr:MAG: MFS transporter [bacterium]
MSKSQESQSKRNPWAWVPSLYFVEGLPYVVVMTVSVIMYKRLGLSNTDIALYTSWLYLPWVIKPLWSPIVDLLKTKRWWIITMQLLIGGGFAGVALTIPMDSFFQYSLAFLWLLAFSSATHDIAADGFYIHALDTHNQAWFVGIRSTFYRMAMITGQGLLIILAGFIETSTGLKEVNFTVSTSTELAEQVFIHPDSLQLPTLTSQEIQLAKSEILIPTQVSANTDSLMRFAKSWNAENGFVVADVTHPNTTVQTAGPSEPSLWQKIVVLPLEKGIKAIAGKEEIAVIKKQPGNIGFVYLHLTQEPTETVVLNLGRSDGDNSISLVEGTRITFTKDNWQKAAIGVIQLDPKLKKISSATFNGTSGNIPFSWSITFFILTGIFVLASAYHKFSLPRPSTDKSISETGRSVLADFFATFGAFFKKKDIGLILSFLLLYRFAEAQIVKLASPFLLDAQEAGGLALTTGEVGFVYGTVGILALTVGGLLGGFLAAKDGLKKWLWPMVIAMNFPNIAYWLLSVYTPESFVMVNLAVAFEQFGYGFGFTAYMLYMLYVAQGEHQTAHYAICTGFMALGMMLPGMISGWIQSLVGYENFFIWVLIATIPAFWVSKLIKVDPNYGKKEAE